MCFGGSTKAPAATAAPSPAPTPTASDPSPVESSAQKAKKLDAIRYGMASTIKTSGFGLMDKPTLITSNATGLKDKLGS